MRSSKLFWLGAIFGLAVAAVIFTDAIPTFSAHVHALKAKRICDKKGTFRANSAPRAKGYLLSRNDMNNAGMRLTDIARELLEKRFTYIELPYRHYQGGSDLFAHAVGNGNRFFRFFLAPINSPACTGFMEEMKSKPYLKLPSLRSMGLPVNLCIGSERTNESHSQYEIVIDSNYRINYEKSNGGTFNWGIQRVLRDRNSGDILAEVTSTALHHTKIEPAFACNNHDQVQLFEKSALEGIPDSRLSGPIEWTDIGSVPFPLELELKAHVVAELSSDRIISKRELYGFLHPMSDSGNIFMHDSYRLRVITSSGGIQADVQKAFGKGWMGFQHIKQVRGDIIFFGQAISMQSRDVAVFRYNQNAMPQIAYRIFLPEIYFKGDTRYIVDDISISNDWIDLTILDVTRGQNGRNFKVLTEYKLRAPIRMD